jgi:hypothetical protein
MVVLGTQFCYIVDCASYDRIQRAKSGNFDTVTFSIRKFRRLILNVRIGDWWYSFCRFAIGEKFDLTSRLTSVMFSPHSISNHEEKIFHCFGNQFV